MENQKTKFEEIKREFPRRINVGTISDQFWCEKQVELRCLYEIEKESEELKKGRERHEELHKEVSKLCKIPTPKKTEDNVGIVLHNALVGILRLAKVGLTRELPILGCIDGWYILGVIDELKINDGKLQVIERKTRKSNRSPSPSQLLVHKIQGMLYYKLLSRLQKDNVDYWKEFAEAYDLDLNAKMSDEYLELLVERGVVEEKILTSKKISGRRLPIS